MQIAILGAGSWGTALASLLGYIGYDVVIWSKEDSVVNEINNCHTNTRYCSGSIPLCVRATNNISDIKGSDIVFFVIPTNAISFVSQILLSADCIDSAILVSCSKGIDVKFLEFPFLMLERYFPNNSVAVLSGPNFASEVMDGKSAATNIAARDIAVAETVANVMHCDVFAVHPIADPIAVQVAGTVKNIIAISCGLAMGWNMGENARAIAFSMGLSEMSILCEAMGGNKNNLLSLAGIGDLFLTCASKNSRNNKLGFNIAQGVKISNNVLAEGALSIVGIKILIEKLELCMPLCSFVASAVDNLSACSKQYSSVLLCGCGEIV